MKDFKKLITLALKDGKISDRERELILKKASNLGIDEIEAEMVLEGMISDHDNGIKNEKSVEINPDGYSIEDAELIMRTTNWVNRCSDLVELWRRSYLFTTYFKALVFNTDCL